MKPRTGAQGSFQIWNGSPGLMTGGTWSFEARYRPVARVGRVKEKGERRETGPERWARWRSLIEEGVYSSRAELARGEGVSRAAVTQPPRRGSRS
jgi:hypothetical protein